MYSRSPLYLQFRKSGYTFRYSLPKDVRSYFNRNEIKFALRTHSFSKARSLSRLMSCRVQWMIDSIRKVRAMDLLTDEQIAYLVKKQFLDALESDEIWRVLRGWSDELEPLIEEDERFTMEELGKSDYSKVLFAAQSLAAELLDDFFPDEIDANDFSIKKLCRELLKAQIKFHEIWKARQRGDYSNEPSLIDSVFKDQLTNTTESVPIRQQSLNHSDSKVVQVAEVIEDEGRRLTQLVELYADECRSTNKWKGRTEAESLSTFQLIVRILGDVPINTIKRQDIAEFKSTIMKLPPNLNKKPEYRDKTIPEVIRYVEKHKREKLSLVTVKKYLMRVNALFDFAEIHGYIDSNPARGISVNVKKADKIVVAPFTEDEFGKLYNSDAALNYKFRYPWQPWLLAIAPLTGCRLEEMAQLYLSDIRQEEGLWVLDINDDAPDKTLKTEAANRLIPLHPFLIDDLGLIEFVEKLKKRGEQRLFPDLKLQSKGGFGRAVTRWFPKFREKVGISRFDNKGHKKVFHSFRHTFSTTLKHQYVDSTMIDELIGHAVEKLSMGTYGAKYSVLQVYEDAILKLSYNLSRLSRFAENCFTNFK